MTTVDSCTVEPKDLDFLSVWNHTLLKKSYGNQNREYCSRNIHSLSQSQLKKMCTAMSYAYIFVFEIFIYNVNV